MKQLITSEAVEAACARGLRQISAPFNAAIVTPAAWSKAAELGVVIVQDAAAHDIGAQDLAARAAGAQDASQGSAERSVDPSGITVVRGQSVRLGAFAAAGPGKQVQLADVITKRDGSPMGAGIMSYARDDSFAWTLGYDEVDLVLEGTLEIRIDGRAIQGGPGDIFYIPKGSRIVFATPDRVRIFYVAHPADWSG